MLAFSPYAIEPLGGLHVAFPDFMSNSHDVTSVSDLEHYVARLEHAGRQFDQVIATADDDADHGVLPPRSVLQAVLRDARAFAAQPTAESPLLVAFLAKLSAVPALREAERKSLVARAARAVDEVVRPAYARYVAEVAALTKRATDDAGLWRAPGGDARYARYLRLGTASDLTPAEVHAMGLARVEQLAGNLRAVLAKLGVSQAEAPDAPLATLLPRTLDDPRFVFPATPEGRARVLTEFRSILDENTARLDRVSHIPLPAKLTVEPLPAYQEGTGVPAHYNPPPVDDSKPGVFFVDLSAPLSRCYLRAIAAHEGIPGHHFQQTVARHQEDLPMFRQLIPFASYIEGWATWAEVLIAETVPEDDACDRVGFLTSQLDAALGCVLDTGIHAKRWTRAEADAYAAPFGRTFDLDRVIVWPGQACAYFVGEQTIERLAAKARAALGSKFELPRFNDAILEVGAVPMPVLEKVVDRWIASQAR